MKRAAYAILLTVVAVVWFWLAMLPVRAQSGIPEGAMGDMPLPAVVGMNGVGGHVLFDCTLEGSTHEIQEGYANCSKGKLRASFSVPPAGIPYDVLREHLGADVEIVLRRRAPRKREEISR